MMHILKLTALAGMLAIAGCNTGASYDVGREALKGSPALRADFVNNCTRNIARKPIATQRAMAKLMNVSVRNTPRVYCQRVTRGVASGRLTNSDLSAGARGQLTPNVVRVLQGR
ncbi:hypothetical protein ABFT80_05590 [Mesorhizobium sp. SB112]|uniref:hypothetical protein n=1 Tax=Mesorhizobium sp. SB112 TaxID=3151853 RepID=UPI003263104D